MYICIYVYIHISRSSNRATPPFIRTRRLRTSFIRTFRLRISSFERFVPVLVLARETPATRRLSRPWLFPRSRGADNSRVGVGAESLGGETHGQATGSVKGALQLLMNRYG